MSANQVFVKVNNTASNRTNEEIPPISDLLHSDLLTHWEK